MQAQKRKRRSHGRRGQALGPGDAAADVSLSDSTPAPISAEVLAGDAQGLGPRPRARGQEWQWAVNARPWRALMAGRPSKRAADWREAVNARPWLALLQGLPPALMGGPDGVWRGMRPDRCCSLGAGDEGPGGSSWREGLLGVFWVCVVVGVPFVASCSPVSACDMHTHTHTQTPVCINVCVRVY